ncbi:MAG TPA: hypothetical protein VGM83_20085 [Devosiaceae bacterium]
MRIKNLRLALVAVLGLLMAFAAIPAASAATAHLYGTPVWTLKAAALRAGPGGEYKIVGNIDALRAANVYRCTEGWCQLNTGHGLAWIQIRHLTFGNRPHPGTPHRSYPGGFGGAPGLVCFYTGRNYTGTKTCAAPGTVVKDLALYGRDNTAASIQLTGDVSVTVCRDFDLSSYCSRVVTSKPALNGFLSRNISSFQVH